MRQKKDPLKAGLKGKELSSFDSKVLGSRTPNVTKCKILIAQNRHFARIILTISAKAP
jgi:hypothetical protein